MNDGFHVGPRFVNLSMNVSLTVHATALGINRLAVADTHLENVILGHQCGWHRLRDEKYIRIFGRARANMAERVENALVDQYLVRRHDLLLQSVVRIARDVLS